MNKLIKNINDLYIKSIFPTNSIVEAKIKDHTFIRCFYLGTPQEDIEFYYSYYNDIKDININWIPPSNLVYLSKKKYKKWGDREYYQYEGEIQLIIRSDIYPNLYEILHYYQKGYNLVSRMERYRNLYLAYEQLTQEIELPFRAIRHSLSHSRNKLTDKKVVNYLITNFGDIKINLNKYSNNKKFYCVFRRMGENCEHILLMKLLEIIPEKPNLFGKYYYPN